MCIKLKISQKRSEKVSENNKNKVEITVCGIKVVLVTDESEEYVLELAQRLDKRVNDLTLNHGKCTRNEALVFSAIEALDAATKLKKKCAELKGNVNE